MVLRLGSLSILSSALYDCQKERGFPSSGHAHQYCLYCSSGSLAGCCVPHPLSPCFNRARESKFLKSDCPVGLDLSSVLLWSWACCYPNKTEIFLARKRERECRIAANCDSRGLRCVVCPLLHSFQF